MLDANEGILDAPGSDELVQLDLDRGAIPVLRVLDQEDHQKGHDGRASVDDELPSVREIEEWSGHSPSDNDEESQSESESRTSPS